MEGVKNLDFLESTTRIGNGKKNIYREENDIRNLKRKKINEIINKYKKNMTFMHGGNTNNKTDEENESYVIDQCDDDYKDDRNNKKNTHDNKTIKEIENSKKITKDNMMTKFLKNTFDEKKDIKNYMNNISSSLVRDTNMKEKYYDNIDNKIKNSNFKKIENDKLSNNLEYNKINRTLFSSKYLDNSEKYGEKNNDKNSSQNYYPYKKDRGFSKTIISEIDPMKIGELKKGEINKIDNSDKYILQKIESTTHLLSNENDLKLYENKDDTKNYKNDKLLLLNKAHEKIISNNYDQFKNRDFKKFSNLKIGDQSANINGSNNAENISMSKTKVNEKVKHYSKEVDTSSKFFNETKFSDDEKKIRETFEKVKMMAKTIDYSNEYNMRDDTKKKENVLESHKENKNLEVITSHEKNKLLEKYKTDNSKGELHIKETRINNDIDDQNKNWLSSNSNKIKEKIRGNSFNRTFDDLSMNKVQKKSDILDTTNSKDVLEKNELNIKDVLDKNENSNVDNFDAIHKLDTLENKEKNNTYRMKEIDEKKDLIYNSNKPLKNSTTDNISYKSKFVSKFERDKENDFEKKYMELKKEREKYLSSIVYNKGDVKNNEENFKKDFKTYRLDSEYKKNENNALEYISNKVNRYREMRYNSIDKNSDKEEVFLKSKLRSNLESEEQKQKYGSVLGKKKVSDNEKKIEYLNNGDRDQEKDNHKNYYNKNRYQSKLNIYDKNKKSNDHINNLYTTKKSEENKYEKYISKKYKVDDFNKFQKNDERIIDHRKKLLLNESNNRFNKYNKDKLFERDIKSSVKKNIEKKDYERLTNKYNATGKYHDQNDKSVKKLLEEKNFKKTKNYNNEKLNNTLNKSINFESHRNKKVDTLKKAPEDIFTPSNDPIEQIKKKYKDVINRVNHNINKEKKDINTSVEVNGLNLKVKSAEEIENEYNERIKARLDAIENYFNKDKIDAERLKIAEENKIKEELNLKRKMYELKIRENFKEKIRLRKEMNEKNRSDENVKNDKNSGNNEDKPEGKIPKDQVHRNRRDSNFGRSKKKKKNNKFDDYSSDGSYYKYMYRNLYEETYNNRLENHYHDINDNLYLQECSDNFFHNPKRNSVVSKSLSNSFDKDSINISVIKFDDFDYNYLNNRKVSTWKKRESRYSNIDDNSTNIKNLNLEKPKVVPTDSEESLIGHNNYANEVKLAKEGNKFEKKKHNAENSYSKYGDKQSNLSDSSIIKMKKKTSQNQEKYIPNRKKLSYQNNKYEEHDDNVINKLLRNSKNHMMRNTSILIRDDISQENNKNYNDNKNVKQYKDAIEIQERDCIDETGYESETYEKEESIHENEINEEYEKEENIHENEMDESYEENRLEDSYSKHNEEYIGKNEYENNRSRIEYYNNINPNIISFEKNYEPKPVMNEYDIEEDQSNNIKEDEKESVISTIENYEEIECKDESKEINEEIKEDDQLYDDEIDEKQNEDDQVYDDEIGEEIKEDDQVYDDEIEDDQVYDDEIGEEIKEDDQLYDDEIDDKQNEDQDSKSSIKSSDTGMPKINILQNKENYIPLDEALNFVIDNEKLKKTKAQKENKGNPKNKTFVQWLMDERKKRLKNNLPIDI
ncbi:hypothetical protein YYE_04351 [Plasmodium vinckei vinckei]|uniref:Uncharacterized protein n=1 Tax=Plasmodium vinckei vinckei TaxID=54757 RepID=A0A081IB47_PLAVN|nr:hypothetical protein YYE_04351 [Plasmodium vinckei vinckei]